MNESLYGSMVRLWDKKKRGGRFKNGPAPHVLLSPNSLDEGIFGATPSTGSYDRPEVPVCILSFSGSITFIRSPSPKNTSGWNPQSLEPTGYHPIAIGFPPKKYGAAFSCPHERSEIRSPHP